MLAAALFFSKANAFTAVTSGNWSSAATWGGVAPGSNVNSNDIIIPSGLTVTLDMDVAFAGLLNSLTIDGTLNGNANYGVWISQGTLAGSGMIDIDYLIFSGILTGNSFKGTMNVKTFRNRGTSLSLTSNATVEDTLYLEAGSLSLGTGGNLTLKTNATVVIDDGTLTTGGGVFNSGNNYSVIYMGSSKTTGIELNSASIQDVYIRMSDNDQALSLGNNLVVNGTLYLNSGSLVIDGKQITLKGGFRQMAGATISSNASSNIVVQGSTFTNGMMFTPGSSINELMIDLETYGMARLSGDLHVTGTLRMMRGYLWVENGATLTMSDGSTVHVEDGAIKVSSGTFASAGNYNVEYMGIADSTGIELTGTGLHDVTIDHIGSPGDGKVVLGNDVVIGGNLNMKKGHLDLNGNDVTVNGTFHQNPDAWLVGNTSSSLNLNLSSSSNDTLYIDQSSKSLQNLKLNINGGGTVMLGSQLNIVNQLDLDNGKIFLGNNDLVIESTGTIINYDDNNYVVTNGSGRLAMQVNPASPYVLFPIGTSVNYSPASIQQTASGTSGKFMVRAINEVYAQGTTGFNSASTNSLVARTWMIESATGTTVNMNLKLAWKAAAEMNGFNRSRSYISHYINSKWDTYTKASASASANSTFELQRTGITSLSPFTVADSTSALAIPRVASANANITIYPNPASETVTINMPGSADNYTYELLDVTGKVILSQDGNNSFRISDLNNGYYYIKAVNLETSQATTTMFIKF